MNSPNLKQHSSSIEAAFSSCDEIRDSWFPTISHHTNLCDCQINFLFVKSPILLNAHLCSSLSVCVPTALNTAVSSSQELLQRFLNSVVKPTSSPTMRDSTQLPSDIVNFSHTRCRPFFKNDDESKTTDLLAC